MDRPYQFGSVNDSSLLHQPLAGADGVVLPIVMAHAPEDIDAHLQQQMWDINRDPVLHDGLIIAAIKVHHAHLDALAGRRGAEELAAFMRRPQVAPAAGDRVIAIADADEMPCAPSRRGREKPPGRESDDNLRSPSIHALCRCRPARTT